VRGIAKKDWFTLANAAAGFTALLFARDYPLACALLLAAVFFDWLDGRVARKTRPDEFGKQLDSLADAVSFGAAPAFVVLQNYGGFLAIEMQLLAVAAALFYLSAALVRLARFNLQAEKAFYKGLPTPAAALLLLLLSFLVPSMTAVWLAVCGALMLGDFKINKP